MFFLDDQRLRDDDQFIKHINTEVLTIDNGANVPTERGHKIITISFCAMK